MKDGQNDPIEPIAIVGMSFRFPGDLSDEQAFWEALKEGRDVVSQIGRERWAVEELRHPKRAEPGRSVTFSAGILSHVKEFDAAFFGISPREAAWLDPQQRLLLELAWEAMENGGQIPAHLAGSNCSVHVGISALDYGVRGTSDLAGLSMHYMTGNTLSIAANRLSYVFDLRGPSMSVDTACSSSLVALHQACNSLRSGETSVALVGSVNLLLHPYPFIGFTKASMISSSGRCRAFDASAEGYVRAEGGAVLLLKPLAQAEEDGDPIQAVILATGVNADGARKSGLTIPSRLAQAELMRSVLKSSGLEPGRVDYIEAHGTGTAVGDPIEANAIGEVYGRQRDAPLPIGSVKTNLGHLEAASGIAGLIKTVLMLKHRALPPSLHFATPNPNIEFSDLNLHVVTRYTPLKQHGYPLVMGVNSFGFGGSNAHVLLQAYRAVCIAANTANAKAAPLFLSARTPDALREMAGRYAEFLRRPDAPRYYDIAYSAAFRRQHLEHRLALKPSGPEAAAELLERFAQKEALPDGVIEDALPVPGAIAFVYSGNGAQWAGMGQRLLLELPRFAEIMKEIDAAMASRAGFSILRELRTNEADSRLADTCIAQPLLFAIQVAITRLLRERGIDARAVAGHSVGEVAAAWAAGALTLGQAIDVICARSKAQGLTRGSGRMAAVALSEEAVRGILAGGDFASLEIAGINSPCNVTLAGGLADLEALREKLEAGGVFFRLLELDYAFHSRSMDAIRVRIEESLCKIAPERSLIDFVSTVTGEIMEGTHLAAGYWWNNVRQPVRFARAMQTLIGSGCRIFVEIGPHSILQRYMTECLGSAQATARVLETLRRSDDGAARLDEAIMHIHLSAADPDLRSFFPAPGRSVTLPNYPWQRESYWHPSTSESAGLFERSRVHPLLGWRLGDGEAVWENTLDPIEFAYLADHRVGGAIVFPAAAYVEMALAASRQWFGGDLFELEELNIMSPIVFDGEHARSLRFEFLPREGTFRILSRQRLSSDDWHANVTGRLLGAPTRPAPGVETSGPTTGAPVAAAAHYRLAGMLGLEYGPAFQGFAGGYLQGDVLEGRLVLPTEVQETNAPYLLHPVLLDACFQSLVDFFRLDIEAGQGLPLLPVKFGRLRYFGGAPPSRFRVRLRYRAGRSAQAEIALLDEEGRIVSVLDGCRFRAASLQLKGKAEPARWRIAARLTPHPIVSRTTNLPGNEALVKQARSWLADAEPRLRRQAYFKDGLSLFDALVVSYAYTGFRTLDARHPAVLQDALNCPGDLPNDRRAYFQWLAQCLRETGLLKATGGVWYLEEANAPPPAEYIWQTLLADFPDALTDLLPIGRLGRNLTPCLCGEQAVEDLRDALQRSHLSGPWLSDGLPYRGVSAALGEILRGIGCSWPGNRRLRILEISRGSTGLLRGLANHFPTDRVDYVIAASHPKRLADLEAEYHGHSFVTVAALEETSDLPLTAGSKLPDSFDIVIVYHWLHQAPNSAATLLGLRNKLAQGGLLVLAERPPSYAADFVFGLDPSWWRETGGEQRSSLRDPGFWSALLKTKEFDAIETLIEPADQETRGGAYLLLARNREAPAALPELGPATWLLLHDVDESDCNLDERLAQRLKSRGQRVISARTGSGDLEFRPGDAKAVHDLIETMQRDAGHIDHIVYFGDMRDEPEAPKIGPDSAENTHCVGTLHLVQALAQGDLGHPRLWLVTSGGALLTQPGTDWKINPISAPLWGLGRVIKNEFPELSCTLIDIAFDPKSSQTVDRLQSELLSPDGESENVLSEEARFGLRLQRDGSAEKAEGEPAPRFRLDFKVPGQLRNLLWLPQVERELDADEIEVRPAAAGVNFRDIMYAMGLLPDEAVENGFAGASLGLEFAGTVCRVGRAVSEYRVGDEVMGFGAACFASHVVTKAGAVTRKPETWSFEQAATVPTTFFTVYYALNHLANLQFGERVLIHGAAGGVGIAAIQVARHLGADIFATAGSDEKRDFVRLLGIDHVFDSRSLAFADDILAATNGEGVDVVLNSLSGEAINRNLRVLKPFGRFLELGKRDFFENTHIGLRPFRNNISYFGIDADQLLIARPQLASLLFREVMALFSEGALTPLPYRTFPAESVVEAFRTMQQSHHIGKLVVGLADARVSVTKEKESPPPLRLKEESSYLVTGGLEGFGLETACWLAEHGTRHLVLLSRRGKETPGAAVAVARLEALGTRVHVFACDVADRAGLAAVFFRIARELPALRGVVHAAAVIDDGLLPNLTAARFRGVLSPKVLGAWNLHALTQGLPLDYFILYSSISSYIGNPGQGNYVAANAYLEALAAWRRRHGLPGTCVNWGPIGDAGYLTRNVTVKDNLMARWGAKPLAVRQALEMLERLLVENSSHIAVADIDWPSIGRILPFAGVSRFESLRRSADRNEAEGETANDILLLIAGKPPQEIQPIVQNLIVAEVAKILCINRERIDPAQSLPHLGLDSLMAVELALSIESRLGVSLPAMTLKSSDDNIEHLSMRLAAKLSGAEQEQNGDRLENLVMEMAAQHAEDMSAEELSETVEDVRRQAQAGAMNST